MSRFIANEDGTTTDTKTGLAWSKTIAKSINFKAAEQQVSELGEGWRIPTDHELLSIVDRSRHNPAIETEFFPDTESDWYWTSTPCAWNDAAVWVVLFGSGDVYHGPRNYNACVRAVRSSQ
jgi:hypothetical protein